eukprot:gene9919-13342_t
MRTLVIAGFSSCGAFVQAKAALLGLATIFPKKYQVSVKEYQTRDEYFAWLTNFRPSLGLADDVHRTSPLVWFEEDGTNKYLGGRDDSLAWCRSILTSTASEGKDGDANGKTNVDPWNPEHGFDYDLIVIGGGSGGLACSKEAQKLGAKVAVLDYVKPSPIGSKWGLGGTCVNVGCIPKKLMHNAALLGESALAAKGFGWNNLDAGVHNWEAMRESVQDHIKGLNFGYRVQLREHGITYLNKLGRFVGPNQLECVDNKGKVQLITGARFVIATGGRPSALTCPGAEFALTSDDIFMKEKSPGKTCVIGAGYVALECAGFLTGLKQGEVTVLCRSMLLRGFDRDAVEYIEKYMEHAGTKIIKGVIPNSIEKLANGRFLVSYGDNVSEEFDTVLQAVGREADLKGLQLEAIGMPIEISPKTGKLVCKNEQTTVPHVYAIGDVINGAPELTPVAILAGKLLSRRLFGNSNKLMNYKNIATTVFTPIEYGTVGLNEDDAKNQYGEAAIESYVSAFQPLEWTISGVHHDINSYAKLVVNKEDNNKVVGIHIVSPNAGEIIQGYAIAFNKGITYEDLMDSVGIHPTIAEEFTVISTTKSSGESITKSGC